MFGNAIALVAIRAIGPGAGALAVSIASTETILRWNHPWAWLIWTAEGIFLAFAKRWMPLVIADFLFWGVLGVPLLVLTYGVFMRVGGDSLILSCLKQPVNGLTNVLAAELLYMAFSGVRKLFHLKKLPSTSSLYAVISTVLVAFTLIPGIFILGIQAQSKDFPLDLHIRDRLLKASNEVKARFDAFSRNDFETTVALAKLIVELKMEKRTASLPGQDSPETSLNDLNGGAAVPVQIDCSDEREPLGKLKQSLAQMNLDRPDFSIAVRGSYVDFVIPVPDKARQVCRIISSISTEKFDRQVFDLNENGGIVAMLVNGKQKIPLGKASYSIDTLPIQNLGSDETVKVNHTAPVRFGLSFVAALENAVWTKAFDLKSGLGWRVVLVYSPKYEIETLRYRQSRVLMVLLALTAISILVALSIAYFVSKSLKNSASRISNRDVTAGSAYLPSAFREISDINKEIDEMEKALRITQRELKVNQDHLNTFLSYAPLIVYRTKITARKRGDVSFISKSVSRVLGYSVEETGDAGWWMNNIHPDDQSAVNESFSSVSPGLAIEHEYRFRRKCGNYMWVYDTFVPLIEDSGESIGIGFLLDITDRKDMHYQHLRAARMANLGEMATSMAHELNQPLNTIKIAAFNIKTRLEMGILDKESCEARVERIIRQTDRAANLISHMRIFGREPAEQAEPFQLSQAINGALTLVEYQLDALGIQVNTDIPPGLPSILGHLTLMEQVFVNLFMNVRDAVKSRATRGQTDNFEILVTALLRDSFIEIRVRDNAGGIRTDILDRVFEPFITTKQLGDGVGLGLSISYGIIGDMGGSIDASNVGDGACFVIQIPAAPELSAV